MVDEKRIKKIREILKTTSASDMGWDSGDVEFLLSELDEAQKEIESYDELLQLQNTRYGVATEYWRKFHEGWENIYPDLGDLLDFLMKMIALHEVVETKHLEQIKKLQAADVLKEK